MTNISTIRFNYKGKEDPTDYSSDLANRFIQKPPTDVLSGDYTSFEYDENLIRDTINKFQIKNCNIYLLSRSNEDKVNLTEKWYGTKYSKEKFSQNIIDIYNGKYIKNHKHILNYPPENKFIASNFDIKANENKEKTMGLSKADLKEAQDNKDGGAFDCRRTMLSIV